MSVPGSGFTLKIEAEPEVPLMVEPFDWPCTVETAVLAGKQRISCLPIAFGHKICIDTRGVPALFQCINVLTWWVL